MRFTLIVLVAVLAALSGGCRKKETLAEKIMEKAMKSASGNKAEVDISGDTVRITTEDGDVVIAGGANAALPENLPADVPIYKNAGVMQTMDGGDKGFHIMLTTAYATGNVVEYYKKAIEEKGWTSEGTVDMPGHWMMTCVKGEASLQVMITSADEGETMISLSGQTTD